MDQCNAASTSSAGPRAIDRTVAVWADNAEHLIAILMRQSSFGDGQNVKTRGGDVLLDNILSAVEKTGVDMATIERLVTHFFIMNELQTSFFDTPLFIFFFILMVAA